MSGKATNRSLDFQAFGFLKRSLLMQISIRIVGFSKISDQRERVLK